MDSNSIEESAPAAVQYFAREEQVETAAIGELNSNQNDLLYFLDGWKIPLEVEEETKCSLEETAEETATAAEENQQWFSDVEVALNNWLQQIIYVESNFKTSKSIQLRVDESMDRMRIEELLSFSEFEELKSVGKLWRELIELLSCYNIGIVANKRRIIEILLTLYTVKQLSIDIFLDTVLQL